VLLNIPIIKLLNDFVAVGFGILDLKSEDILILNPPSILPQYDGIKLVAGVGTGLGISFVTTYKVDVQIHY
jgi:glucokinase